MPEDYSNNTITFSMEEVREADMKRILLTVYDALKEKGYNPISQIVGYILSEDPTYITLSEQKKQSFPTYKGKPLVRSGDTIYYGSMKDKYVIKMDIKSKKKVGDLEVADKVTVQLMYTDPEIRTRKQIVKTSEKNGLYLALDIADAWLTRALAE